jgi:soluble lytic murein transglycosylase
VRVVATPPDGYAHNPWFDPDAARRAFDEFALAQAARWPSLTAARELALAGLYADAAAILRAAFEEWKEAEGRADPASQDLRALDVSNGEWRLLALHVRAHDLVARLAWGLLDRAPDPAAKAAALRLEYPVVEAGRVWSLCREQGVDPLLLLGLMRQESHYRPAAESSAGALGLVQVMPRTGARLAALLGDPSPGDLADPDVNLRYGVAYFGLLMRRFGGAFPMAVAAYNGGPHNLSRWYRPWRGRVSTDAMVELIPWKETRDYVKKVTGYYARYVELYGPAGAAVAIPEAPGPDDASVVDF